MGNACWALRPNDNKISLSKFQNVLLKPNSETDLKLKINRHRQQLRSQREESIRKSEKGPVGIITTEKEF